MKLQGTVALVTGGAHRVGKAIALELAQAGAAIVFSYRSSGEQAARTAAEIRALGVDVLAVEADVADPAAVSRLAAQAVAWRGRADLLVNSAASFTPTPWSSLTPEQWDEVLAVNLRGPLLCAHALAAQLAARGQGVIINISDLSAYKPSPGFLAHSVAKAGLVALTRGLAVELAPAVRVNAVVPGPVLAPPDYDASQRAEAADATLLKRWGSGEDVARAVRFLAENDYITGEVLRVDGGQLIGS